MWWRAVPVAVLITYLLCVLLLSGLQKDDLDVDLLSRLQRHNVNIDHIHDENIRQKCLALNHNRTNETNVTVTTKSPTKSNYSTENNNITDLKQNITQLWVQLSKINKENVLSTNSQPTNATTKINTMDYIRSLLSNYITQQQSTTTTQLPTTLDINIVLEEIKNLLTQNIGNLRKSASVLDLTLNQTTTEQPKTTTLSTNVEKNVDDERNHVIKSIKLAIKQLYDANKKSNDHTQSIDVNKIQDSNNDFKNEPQVIPEKIIKDLTENIKTIVLEDIKKEILVTTEKTTTITPVSPRENEKYDTIALTEFIELYHQFKAANENIKSNINIKHPKGTNPLANLFTNDDPKIRNSINEVERQEVISITNNSFNKMSHINTPIIHNLAVPTNVLGDLHSVPVFKSNTINKIAQVNYFHAKSDLQTHPITIQTNAGLIPPLSLPIAPPVKLIYQNIVVTTMHPFDQYKNNFNHRDYTNDKNVYLHKKYNEKSRVTNEDHFKSEQINTHIPWSHSRSDINERHSPRYARYRSERPREGPSYDGFYVERESHRTLHPNKLKWHRGRNERFHERLERVDTPPQSEENLSIDKTKLRVAPRKQRPLNEVRNHSRFDDTHFKNFLKTQQKVNDMLERILATKTIPDRPRSVETT